MTHPLSELVFYSNGKLISTIDRGKILCGDEVGSFNAAGYRQFSVYGKHYYTHRVVWELHNGSIPEGMEIDHINRNKADNRIENLRVVNRLENSINQDHKGCWLHKGGKWTAQIKRYGKRTHLGVFDTEAEASAAYQKAKEEYEDAIKTK